MSTDPTDTGTAGPAGSRGGARGSARVVVGVDGSPGASAALVWALAEAARSGADVEVVSAFPVDDYWTYPLLADPRVEAKSWSTSLTCGVRAGTGRVVI